MTSSNRINIWALICVSISLLAFLTYDKDHNNLTSSSAPEFTFKNWKIERESINYSKFMEYFINDYKKLEKDMVASIKAGRHTVDGAYFLGPYYSPNVKKSFVRIDFDQNGKFVVRLFMPNGTIQHVGGMSIPTDYTATARVHCNAIKPLYQAEVDNALQNFYVKKDRSVPNRHTFRMGPIPKVIPAIYREIGFHFGHTTHILQAVSWKQYLVYPTWVTYFFYLRTVKDYGQVDVYRKGKYLGRYSWNCSYPECMGDSYPPTLQDNVLFGDKISWFPDQLHPNASAATVVPSKD